MSTVDEMVICEELSRGDPGFGTASYHTMLASFPILTGGTEEQKAEYLGRVTEGKLAAYCVTEPDAGSDVQALKTEAVRDGEEYVINGSKAWILGQDMQTGSSFWPIPTNLRVMVDSAVSS